jgi:protein-S-isoprenylcysteine O-methyltransferase Ste14
MMITHIALIWGLFLLFGVIHSLTAGFAPKERLSAVLPARLVEGWYRLLYNVFSGITFSPVLIAVAVLPDRVIYAVPMPWSLLFRLAQLGGVAGLVGALFVTDVFRFAGISQAIAYLSGEPLPLESGPLQVKGMYAVVRHPLYLFSLLAIWPTPTLTLNMLLFNIGATLYFVVGSRIEERRLEKRFGDAYRAYRQQVPWLVPVPRPRRAGGHQSHEPRGVQ